MGAIWIKCSACSGYVASEQAFVCVEVKSRSLVIVAMETVNENAAEVICLVHESYMDKFEELVPAGLYSALKSS